MLTGTDLNGNTINRTTTTDINGSYTFTNLSAGTYAVTQTQPVLHVGRAGEFEVKVAVRERDGPVFHAAMGKPLEVRLESRDAVVRGALERVEAKASREPVHPALTALAGGPLAMRQADRAHADAADGSAPYELAEPHFTATVSLNLSQQSAGNDLHPGEMARVRLSGAQSTALWTELRARFGQWVRTKTGTDA